MGEENYGEEVLLEIELERQLKVRCRDGKALTRNTKRQRHGGLRDIWSLECA